MEQDVLLAGLMKDLTDWMKEKRKISKEDFDFLNRQKDRIIVLIDILTEKEIRKLEDLPDDYRGRKGPSDVIE